MVNAAMIELVGEKQYSIKVSEAQLRHLSKTYEAWKLFNRPAQMHLILRRYQPLDPRNSDLTYRDSCTPFKPWVLDTLRDYLCHIENRPYLDEMPQDQWLDWHKTRPLPPEDLEFSAEWSYEQLREMSEVYYTCSRNPQSWLFLLTHVTWYVRYFDTPNFPESYFEMLANHGTYLKYPDVPPEQMDEDEPIELNVGLEHLEPEMQAQFQEPNEREQWANMSAQERFAQRALEKERLEARLHRQSRHV